MLPGSRFRQLGRAAAAMLFLPAILTMTGPGAAEVENIVCEGDDMLAAMARDEPDRLAGIRSEARGEINGETLLWRIEAQDAPPSWLFGTMHVADPRVVSLPERVRSVFDEAATLVIETTDILDPSAMMAALAAQSELMMLTGDTTLASLLDDEQRKVVEEGLDRRGIPLASVNRMQPWMLATMVALPACELQRKASGQPVLDLHLAEMARAEEKQVAGLERGVDQLAAMASLPLSFHLESLVETMRLGDRVEDIMETMIAIYLSGEPGLFWPFFDDILPRADDEAGYLQFNQIMVAARNETMARNALPFIEEGNSFIAVGALHLPGEEGLVALLREAGYRVNAQQIGLTERRPD